MHANPPARCRCCHDVPPIGYFGLCRPCSDAVDRFIATRRANLAKRPTR